MARRRFVSPAFFSDERFRGLPHSHRLAYLGIATQADREGRFCPNPVTLHAAIFPDDPLIDFVGILDDLEDRGAIRTYTSHRKRYGVVVRWKDEQPPHPSELSSRRPAPPAAGGNP